MYLLRILSGGLSVNAIRCGKGYEYVKYDKSEFVLTKERLLSMYEVKK